MSGTRRLGFRGARDIERVGGQQIQERLALFGVALGKGDEALLEFGKHLLGLAGGAAPVQRDERQGDSERHGQHQRKQQRYARAGDAPPGKRERIGDQDEDNGGGQGNRGEDRGAAQHRAQAQPRSNCWI